MSTKMGIWRWALVGAALMLSSGMAGAAPLERSRVTTNDPAGMLLYPDIVVDPDICFPKDPAAATNSSMKADGKCSVSGAVCDFTREDPDTDLSDNIEACASNNAGTDTIVHLTNTTGAFKTRALCFWINSNGHCDNADDIICNDTNFQTVCPLGGLCKPSWDKTDFRMTLTKRQPLSWSAYDPDPLPCDENSAEPCANDQRNDGDSVVLGVPEIPFNGELRCVQISVTNDEDTPIDRNDLKGEASIITTHDTDIDARKYTAIGIPAIPGQVNGDSTLNIGGPEAEYEGCPGVLMLDHFFDGADVGTHFVEGDFENYDRVLTTVTFVPCGANLSTPGANLNSPITLQFLVYNEFEQRFSTSTKVSCRRETRISDIDTRPESFDDNKYSLFWVGVQGTLTGVSHVRPVAGPDAAGTGYDGRGVLAVMSEEWFNPQASSFADAFTSTTEVNTHFRGQRAQGDQMLIP